MPDSGSPTFVDFGYNNVTFPQPQQQLQHYKTAYNMRFGGIRKPRLGNRCSAWHEHVLTPSHTLTH